jgi:hypothetical protein
MIRKKGPGVNGRLKITPQQFRPQIYLPAARENLYNSLMSAAHPAAGQLIN